MRFPLSFGLAKAGLPLILSSKEPPNKSIPGTSRRRLIFRSVGRELCRCYDGIIRNCGKIKSKSMVNGKELELEFYVDQSLRTKSIGGFVSQMVLGEGNKNRQGC